MNVQLIIVVLVCAFGVSLPGMTGICGISALSIPARSVYLLKRSSGPGGLGGWKLPFGRPSFLNRNDDDDDEEDDDREEYPSITSAHLLPEYLTHQEFLKPQLQKAGFSGGRIIAGPFPVPLSKLPKPPSRSGSAEEGPSVSSPIPPTLPQSLQQSLPQSLQLSLPQSLPQGLPQRIPIAPQFNYQQKLPSKPTKAVKYSKAPLKLLQRPLAALAEAAASMRPHSIHRPQPQVTVPTAAAAAPPALPVTTPKPKLIYPIPSADSTNPQWLAAYHSGPETPLSSLGNIKYSLPARNVQNVGVAAADIRLSYGGWTPIYSPATSSIRISKPQASRAVSAQNEDSDEEEVSELKKNAESADAEAVTQDEDDTTAAAAVIQKRTVRQLRGLEVNRRVDEQVEDSGYYYYYSAGEEEEDAGAIGNVSGSRRARNRIDPEGRGQGRYVGRVLPAAAAAAAAAASSAAGLLTSSRS